MGGCVISFFFFPSVNRSKSEDIIAVSCHMKVIILGCDMENCFGLNVLPWQDM